MVAFGIFESMKIKKPLEPNFPGRTDFRPRLGWKNPRDESKSLLSSLKRASRVGRIRSQSRPGSRGKGALRTPTKFGQRVVVKARVVKMKPGKGVKGLRAHIQYLTRSGVSRDGETPSFFRSETTIERQDLKKEINSWSKDEHHFRFIISPRNAPDLNLEDYAKSVLKSFETDLGTKLNWFGVAHYNTDNPHIHIVVRGVDERSDRLLISKEYIKHGLRECAQKEATRRLGFRQDRDYSEELKKSLFSLSYTQIDQSLEKKREASLDGMIRLTKPFVGEKELSKTLRELQSKRLLFLQTYGLSKEVSSGAWSIDFKLKGVLTELHDNNKIKELSRPFLSLEQSLQPLVIHDPKEILHTSIRGEALGVGFKDTFRSNKFVLVSGTDGRVHFLELSKFSRPEGFPVRRGQIVTVSAPSQTRKADQVIDKFAKDNGGVFSQEKFSTYVENEVQKNRWKLPSNSTVKDYLERFSVRIDSLNSVGAINDLGQRVYKVPEDLLEKVQEIDRSLGKKSHLEVKVESYLSLKRQESYKGATWLDSLKSKDADTFPKQTAFGIKVEEALLKREGTLKSIGISPLDEYLKSLKESEVLKFKEKLKKEFGSEIKLREGDSIQGRLHKYKLLGDGFYQVIKNKDGFIVRKIKDGESRLPKGQTVSVMQIKNDVSIERIERESTQDQSRTREL